jgi:hypothetical protein
LSATKSYSVIPLLSTRIRPSRDLATLTVVPRAAVPCANAYVATIEVNAADAMTPMR